VVGVGTGDLLPYLLEEDPSKITCVDSSQAMLDLVRTEAGAKRVELILDTYPIMDQTETYDVIIFDFIVDSLTENEMKKWFTHAKHLSKPSGHVVVLDFNPRRQRSLYTKTVMAFFRLVSDYQRKRLADWCQILDQDTELNEVQSVSSLNKILIAKTWMIC
jgi:cyclopropane fatty-acyl-phospholipid synthase-like methyltransferase